MIDALGNNVDKIMRTDISLAYKVGGLLYTPALNETIAVKIANNLIDPVRSLAFCLEDTIDDDYLLLAEDNLLHSLKVLQNSSNKLPLLFIRIRTPQHMEKVYEKLGTLNSIVTGYILPKFDTRNAGSYIDLIRTINEDSVNKIYMMPILESEEIANVQNRAAVLPEIKAYIDSVREYTLNIRVGGNDFCNLFGVRRSVKQSIYDVGVIRNILTDIINIFAGEYVVSGPVWEYFGSDKNDDWSKGLAYETEMDLLNGFWGKTAIHPAQLQVIHNSMKAPRNDYDDALSILKNTENGLSVSKSSDASRMNENKCHANWANKILIRAEEYGIR